MVKVLKVLEEGGLKNDARQSPQSYFGRHFGAFRDPILDRVACTDIGGLCTLCGPKYRCSHNPFSVNVLLSLLMENCQRGGDLQPFAFTVQMEPIHNYFS